MILLFITLLLPFMLSAADTNDAQPHHIMITTGNESGKIPLHVARLSFFMRTYMQQPIFAQTNVIPLDLPDKSSRNASDLELLIRFLTQAEETLKAKPTSCAGSYVQLANEEPLASATDPEKLLKLFIACDYLQFDFNQSQDFDHDAIKKAIALKMTRSSFDYKKLFIIFDDIAAKYSYNFQNFVWPYITAQRCLVNYYVPYEDDPFTTIFRDVLAHDKLKHWLSTTISNGTTCNLHSINLTSLQGIEDIDLTSVNRLFLSQNKLTHIPNLNCPELQYIDLFHNQLTEVPQCYLPKLRSLNLNKNNIAVLPANFNNFPSLTHINLSNNRITEIPETLKRLGLTIQVGKR